MRKTEEQTGTKNVKFWTTKSKYNFNYISIYKTMQYGSFWSITGGVFLAVGQALRRIRDLKKRKAGAHSLNSDTGTVNFHSFNQLGVLSFKCTWHIYYRAPRLLFWHDCLLQHCDVTSFACFFFIITFLVEIANR